MHEGGHGILDSVKRKGKHAHHEHDHEHEHAHEHAQNHDLKTKLVAGLITIGLVIAFVLWRFF